MDFALPPTDADLPMRLRHLCINVLAFSSTYPLANHVAQLADVQRNVALPLDTLIPFVPWLVIPYLTSALFFIASFFLVDSEDDVCVLSRRLLLATVGATLVFAIMPTRFSLPRPAIDRSLLSTLFDLLVVFDRPYNQFPSLHVAYCLVFWSALRSTVRQTRHQIMLGIWLGVVAFSTVFTYQHHSLDVAGGFALGFVALGVVRTGNPEPRVGFYYLLGAVLTLTVGGILLHQWLAYYLATSLALVGIAYARDDRFFLRKSRGGFPLHAWLLYAPYLFGYLLTWQLVRLRERDTPPFKHVGAGVWTGRRLTASEAEQLPVGCTIIDLANELGEPPALLSNSYFHFPLLDLREPPAAVVADILEVMSAEALAGRPIYVHCAMGYQRSRLIVQRFLDTFMS